MLKNTSYDNVEDRKEIYNILENYLDERKREEFLLWACKRSGTTLSKVLRPGKNSTFHPKEVYWQLMSLAFMHNLDLDMAANKLVQVAKKGFVSDE
jgi:hypothetical protein